MKFFIIWLATGLLLFAGSVNATSVNWIDWNSTTTGNLTIGSQNVAVSLTGNPMNYVDGDYYYNNANTGGTTSGGTYGGLMPSDLIQVNSGGTFTLTFDSEIIDPYISLVSVGRVNLPVSYNFENPFAVISSGSNYWGYTGYSTSGNNFIGYEYNGILQLEGAFSSISFSTNPNEYWHGFNFGATTPVPEPATMILFGLGLLGLAGINRKKR